MAIGSEGTLLSNDVLAKWLIEDVAKLIQLARWFPFFPIDGDSLRYATAAALSNAGAIDYNAAITEQTTLPKSPNRTAQLGELATDFRVAYSTMDRLSNVNDQIAVQTAMAVRRLLYQFWNLFEQGNAATPGQFDGLTRLVDPANEKDLAGVAPNFKDMMDLENFIVSNEGYPTCYYTSKGGYKAIYQAYVTAGMTPQFVPIDVDDPVLGRVRKDALAFNGVPVFKSDFVTESAGKSSIWAMVLGQNNLHGIVPASVGPSMFVVRSTMLTTASTLVYDVTMPAGIALGSLGALARLKNVLIP